MTVTLWIDPPSDHFEQDRLFDTTLTPTSGDGALVPFVHVRDVLGARGVAVHTADLLERRPTGEGVNLYVSTGITTRFERLAGRGDVILSAFIAIEAPVVGRSMYARLYDASRLFRRMFACNRGGSVLSPFLKGPVTFEPILYPYSFESVDERAWSRGERSFLTMVNGNKAVARGGQELYTERLRVLEFFARDREIDLYGVGWEGPPYPVSRRAVMPGSVRRLAWEVEKALRSLRPDPLLLAARSVWRGPVTSKLEALSRYRYSLVIENMQLDGWITEKIFDCMRAGCVPVYLGAPDVDRWVPSECFVDMRQFAGYSELRAYLHSLGERQVRAYREAGRELLASERFRPFTKDAFAEVFARIVSQDAGIQVV